MQDDEVHVEQYQVFKRFGEDISNLSRVLENLPNAFRIALDITCRIGDGAKNGENYEEVEEGEEEVLRDKRHLHFAL